MSAAKCCCDSPPCGGDCELVRADCCENGLQPFTLGISAKMRQSTCQGKRADVYECDHEICTNWGTVECGGCLPCDPTGSLPGANGRTCPCRDQTCELPRGRRFPLMPCKPQSPYLNDSCYYAHPDYYYMTFTGQTDKCETQTQPECPWLGSVSCAFDLVYVPAGYSQTQCAEIRFTHSWVVNQMIACTPGPDGQPIEIPFPAPLCEAAPRHTFYGQQLCTPNSDPPYVCTSCVLGNFPTEVISQPSVSEYESCVFENIYAQVLFAMPCAVGDGEPLSCKYGCDCFPSSYIALTVAANWGSGKFNGYGFSSGWSDLDPNDPDDAQYLLDLCEATIGPPPSSPEPCGPVLPLLDFGGCAEKCCQCAQGFVAVFRRKRVPADGNECTMAHGEYELVAVGGGCGPLGPDYYCGDPAQGICKDEVDQCMPEGILRKRLEQNGVWDLKVTIGPP